MSSGLKWMGLWAAALAIFLSGCYGVSEPVVKEKDGRLYGVTEGLFRGRWWNYYERGLSFADGGFWEEARQDLTEALRQRERDQRRARTYGRHLIHYFPHRELGIVYFNQGRTEEAVRELETSLDMEKSARAEYYLDRARSRIIQENRADKADPEIRIHTPEPGLITNGLSMVVRGFAADDTFVRHIRINDRDLRVDVSSPSIPFRKEVSLQEGADAITVSAGDLSGKWSSVTIPVVVDRLGPIVSIESAALIHSGATPSVRLKGYAFDDSGLRRLKVNDAIYSLAGEKEKDFDLVLPISGNSPSAMLLTVEDGAGNGTAADIFGSVKSDSAGKGMLWARAGPRFSDAGWLLSLHPDNRPPAIDLGDIPKIRKTYLLKAVISGRVDDESHLSALYINGENILRTPRPIRRFSFNKIIRLKPGENFINVRAVDRFGNARPVMVKVIRLTPVAERHSARLSVAVAAFQRDEDRLSRGFEKLLAHQMRKRKRFRISPVPVKSAEADTDFQEIAEQGVDCVLFGEIIERTDTVTVNTRLVDVENPGDSLVQPDVYGESVDMPALRYLSRILEMKLTDELPLVKGRVEETLKQHITVDIGSEKKVKTGMKLVVYQNDEPRQTPEGEILDLKDRLLGEARIKTVEPDRSVALMRSETERGAVRPSHQVITR